MKLLLDTNVLIWWLGGDDRLTSGLLDDLEDESNEVLVSAASVWEIEIKRARHSLEPPDDLLKTLSSQRVELVPVTAADATIAGRLPLHHRDPFDRMIVAQTAGSGAILVTSDGDLAQYGVPVRIAS